MFFKRISKYFIIVSLLACAAGVAVLSMRHGKNDAVESARVSATSVAGNASVNTPQDAEPVEDSGVPLGAIPALNNPNFVSANQAQLELGGEGSGLVVVQGNIARFYPYQILAWHEVVNDKLGNSPIAATYCALCNVGVVYKREVRGQTVEFGVSGKLQGLDSLLYDSTTQSLWSQVTGKAVSGPFVGEQLGLVESTVLSLKDFASQYPQGQVLSKFTGYVRNYDTLSYGDYAVRTGGEEIIRAKGLLHPKTEVVGIEVAEKTKAYPLDLLQSKGVIADTFEGKRLNMSVARGTVIVTDVDSGKPVPFWQGHWFMWQTWKPDTKLYK